MNRIRPKNDVPRAKPRPHDVSTVARWLRKRFRRGAAPFAIVVTFLIASPRIARAEEAIIKNPGDHPHYVFEAEPHGIVGFAGPFRENGPFGVGFRGTIVIVDNGFIRTINNSVGISFGADLFFSNETLFIPVAMQWNFWLSTHWSVFGEPGVGFALKNHDVVHPILMAGGRYHFNEKISLTMRIGYPSFSIGASFFF